MILNRQYPGACPTSPPTQLLEPVSWYSFKFYGKKIYNFTLILIKLCPNSDPTENIVKYVEHLTATDKSPYTVSAEKFIKPSFAQSEKHSKASYILTTFWIRF